MKALRYLFFILFPIYCGGLMLLLIYYVSITQMSIPANILACLIAFFMLVGWFQVGKYFAHHFKTLSSALFMGNLIGVISLCLYLWQVFIPNELVNIYVVRLAQVFSAPLTVVISLVVSAFGQKAVIAFESPPLCVLVQLCNLIFMMAVFAYGYLSKSPSKKYRK